MESRNRTKNGKLVLILIIVFGLTVLALGYLNYKEYKTYNKVKKDYDKSLSLSKEKNTKLKELTNKENELNKNIEEINKVDENIQAARLDYYASLKTFEDKVSNKELDYKIAYITFDDGPYYKTDEFLKILEENNVRATFFTIGADKDKCYDNSKASCKETYYKEFIKGHTMGNHTYSHAIFTGLYSSADSFINQVKKQEDKIYQLTGYKTNIVRFPGGAASAGSRKSSIVEKLRENNYGYVDWTASCGDGGSLDSKNQAWNNFLNTIGSDIEVILFHDYSRYTLEMLPDVIKHLQEHNYVMLPLFYESKMINK